jgi:hypothetical protein
VRLFKLLGLGGDDSAVGSRTESKRRVQGEAITVELHAARATTTSINSLEG